MVAQKILVVDGNSINRAILKKILGAEYVVLEAANGEEALTILNHEHCDIAAVLLDIIMPVMDGYQFLTERKKSRILSSIPVIAMTQWEDSSTELKALEYGATDFVPKPYEPTVIRQRLVNILLLREAAALRNTAERDDLTRVYNKVTFYQKTAEKILSGDGKEYDIIYANIEQFKLINDLFGSQEGDNLLIYTAQMLKGCAHDFNGICGRLHSDIFALCVERQEDYQKLLVSPNMDKIREYKLDFKIIIRYGVYQIDDKSVSVNVMCDRANLAIKSIKGKFEKYIACYDESLRRKLLEEQEITREMKSALDSGQFVAYYQPKFDLATEEIIGAEALVRWIHPQKGLICPDKFIPLFESNGFIVYLDCYIWEEVCKQIRNWIDNGHRPLPISVNLSRVDVYNPALCDILCGLVKKYNIPTELLELEITESAYTESAEQLISTLSTLKKLGFIVQMDDFGSGYSSLNMLNELPIDTLKLDMRFISTTQRWKKDSSGNILNFVMGLSKWMDIPVIAEGIETKEQGLFLRGMGCNSGQGYYFSKPLPQSEFEGLLLASQSSLSKKRPQKVSAFVSLEEMWNADSRFNTIFNSCVGALGIYEFMGDTLAFVRGNDRYYEVVGVNRAAVFSVAKNIIDTVHEDDKEEFLRKLKEAKEDNCSFEIEHRLFCPQKHDKVCWFHREMKVIHRADDRTIFLGLIYNVTEEKELAGEISVQKEFYQELCDTVPCGIVRFACEPEFPLLRINRTAEVMLGISKEDLPALKTKMSEYIPDGYGNITADKYNMLLKMKFGEAASLEYPIVSKKGRKMWLHDTFQVVKGEDGITYYRSVLTDITEQREQG